MRLNSRCLRLLAEREMPTRSGAACGPCALLTLAVIMRHRGLVASLAQPVLGRERPGAVLEHVAVRVEQLPPEADFVIRFFRFDHNSTNRDNFTLARRDGLVRVIQ